MLKHILLLLILLLTQHINAQDKLKINAETYNKWNSISSISQSKSGDLISYEINPLEGDGILYLKSSLPNGLEKTFPRGYKAQINFTENYFVALIKPSFDSVRKLELAKTKKDHFPKDSLVIYSPLTDSTRIIADITSYKMADKGPWFAYHSANDLRTPCPKKKKLQLFRKKKGCELSKTSGKTLFVANPIDSVELIFHNVVDYDLDKNGTKFYYTLSHQGEKDSLSLNIYDFTTNTNYEICTHQFSFKNLTFNENGNQLAFLSTNDTNKLKNYDLQLWDLSKPQLIVTLDSLHENMPNGKGISENFAPYFSKDGKKLFFGIAERNQQEPEDTLLEKEKAVVDVWRGDDLRIQPQQLKEKQRDERKSDLAVYHITHRKMVPLGTESFERVRVYHKGNTDLSIGLSAQNYLKERTWEFPWKNDIYIIHHQSGESELIAEGVAYNTSLSPSENYFVYYNGADSNWYSIDLETKQKKNLTERVSATFAEDNNGNPFIPYSQGNSGWTMIDNHEYYLVNSIYDIWAVSPEKDVVPISITYGQGRSTETIYRLTRFDEDSLYCELTDNLIHGKNDTSKAESYWSIKNQDGKFILSAEIESNHKYTFIEKADDTDKIIFRRMNFSTYPELEVSDLSFQNPIKITNTNPQQSQYNWGTVEQVKWTTYKGLTLNGLLYKPADFDSSKKYPMIVYFYEKYSDNLHFYYSPKPTASIVYPTEYVSNDYIIFIPDIIYESGHPAASAYDCIVSGTDYLTHNYPWIDSTKLGLQGQSWGGYQTAQLITMTKKYAAAMAGAPVSNMFSAYGGIRWGSGLSRMFQYERTQSRIGYTIWEKPELYIENSPLFGLPNVETPLLIMHNDGDGAVPWYQGIELFMGLRRLDQPVWLLNYNGDEHNLMKTANRRDLSIRMRQFFDFYLKGEEMPKWMAEGIPALEKGIDYGLDD
jgi:dipeptidyl aminopeptidase/acylaminoacyl peptidase